MRQRAEETETPTYPHALLLTPAALLSLVGQPPEVDDNDPDSVSSRGLVESSGAKRGAVRKLKHELGVDGCLGEADFHFLTRFHYWASDTRTYGPETEWGEVSDERTNARAARRVSKRLDFGR